MKILIADDHPVVRAGLKRLVEPSLNGAIIEASDGAEVVALVRRHHPAIVVLDINLPVIGGLELLRRLVAADPDVRILIFSMHGETVYARQALRAGALGYVTKTAAPEEIIEAVRQVASGECYLEADLARELALDSVQSPTLEHAALPSLNPRDLELLRLVGAGKSLTEMAGATGVTYKTVANRISLLKARLSVGTTSELVRLAIKSGLSP